MVRYHSKILRFKPTKQNNFLVSDGNHFILNKKYLKTLRSVLIFNHSFHSKIYTEMKTFNVNQFYFS